MHRGLRVKVPKIASCIVVQIWYLQGVQTGRITLPCFPSQSLADGWHTCIVERHVQCAQSPGCISLNLMLRLVAAVAAINQLWKQKLISCFNYCLQKNLPLKLRRSRVITGRMPRSGKLPVLFLLTGQKSGFSPRRGDSLHRFGSNFAGPTGTWVRLAVQNVTSIGAEGWECGPKMWKISTFW